MSGGRQPKAGWAAPSALVIPVPVPRAVQDGDYFTYWPRPGPPGAGRDKLGAGGAPTCPEEAPSLETSARAAEKRGERLRCSQPRIHPAQSIRKLLRNYSLAGPEPSPAEVPGSRW